MRKNILVVIFLIAGLGGGTGIGIGLIAPSLEQAENDSDYWQNEYNDLLADYGDLLNNYNGLWNDYDNLQDSYDNLLEDYFDLFANYGALQEAFEDPLTSYIIPTWQEVQTWLATDDTDFYNYTSMWMCGDFAAMLMTRAKTMNWRMRIACMFWSESGDGFSGGWQNPADPYGSYGHAFNLIYCQDGSDAGTELDIYYIEPQTDKMWYVIISSVPYVHYEIWYTFTGGLSGTVWSEPYYINHYSYFA